MLTESLNIVVQGVNYLQHAPSPDTRYLDTLQRSEDEYAALKDQIKATKAATKKVTRKYTLPFTR